MRQLTLVPIGGLANRIYAITSAIAFCKDYDVKLKIVWFKDKGMGADFHSLFDLSSEVDKSKVEIIDAKWYHYIYDRPRKRNLWLPCLFQKIMFDKLSYEKDIKDTFCIDSLKRDILNNKSFYLVHCYDFYFIERYDCLILKDDIRMRVDEIKLSFGNVIGIHIRRTDNINSILNSPLELFINAMNYEISLDSDVNFFVASDSISEKQKLKEIFGERILTYGHIMERSNEKGIKEALVELSLLSSTKKIYGSAFSSFSILASKLSGVNIVILSVDNNKIGS